jgi:hypothetical protein
LEVYTQGAAHGSKLAIVRVNDQRTPASTRLLDVGFRHEQGIEAFMAVTPWFSVAGSLAMVWSAVSDVSIIITAAIRRKYSGIKDFTRQA